LPASYLYNVKLFESDDAISKNFTTTLGINLENEEKADEWLEQFTKVTKCNFTVRCTRPVVGKYFRFIKDLKCHHNISRGVLGKGKHCGCPATLKLTVNALPKKTRIDRPREREFQGTLKLNWAHNHPIRAADVLRRRPVSKETKETLKSMFNMGHTPSSALHSLKMNLECSDIPEENLADRSVCPDLRAVFYLYYKNFTAEYGSIRDPTNKLRSFIADMNVKFGSLCVSGNQDDTGKWTIAICTPVMKVYHGHLSFVINISLS